MIGIATDLKERFDFAAIWFFERDDLIHGVEHALPDKEAKAVDILKNLLDSIDGIPSSLIKEATGLRDADPELFEKTLVHAVQVVGFGFFPADAAEFIEVFNRTVQRNMAQV
jgi:hypothetical protein